MKETTENLTKTSIVVGSIRRTTKGSSESILKSLRLFLDMNNTKMPVVGLLAKYSKMLENSIWTFGFFGVVDKQKEIIEIQYTVLLQCSLAAATFSCTNSHFVHGDLEQKTKW